MIDRGWGLPFNPLEVFSWPKRAIGEEGRQERPAGKPVVGWVFF